MGYVSFFSDGDLLFLSFKISG